MGLALELEIFEVLLNVSSTLLIILLKFAFEIDFSLGRSPELGNVTDIRLNIFIPLSLTNIKQRKRIWQAINKKHINTQCKKKRTLMLMFNKSLNYLFLTHHRYVFLLRF